MVEIARAGTDEVDAAVAALAEAFAADPLMGYLFGDHPRGVRASTMAFFSILLRVRLALGMPALVLRRDGEVLGAAMGYDATRPQWPASLAAEWARFEASAPELADRMAAYDEISEAHAPAADHYYLGVLGVHPELQGRGAGKALLEAYCEASLADGRSGGVYLDTANPRSLAFYDRNGFERRGEGRLGPVSIRRVFRPT